MRDEAPIRERSTAPVDAANGALAADLEEEMPRVKLTRRHWIFFGLFVVSALAFLYYVLPQIAGLEETWDRIDDGDPYWLGLALVFQALSFGGYIWLFRIVFVRGETKVDWNASYQITMAGLAATRLFAAAGAGGVVLTAWALRRSGMPRRVVARRLIAFMAILYIVYPASLVLVGLGLRVGLLPGGGSFAITVVPAIFGAGAIVFYMLISAVPDTFERRVAAWSQGHPRARLARRLAAVPASLGEGARTSLKIMRHRPASIVAALAWWYFNIACWWACFNAFGDSPTFFELTQAYFLGMLLNLLPFPGGIGGVDGGMIGAAIAFGVGSGLAVVSVLAYRFFAFWLPTIPGVIAYLQLRRTVQRWKDERRAAAQKAPA
jgi:uncharacterized protein (TIRG00374 family)